MNLIGKKTNDIPRTIGKALGLVEQDIGSPLAWSDQRAIDSRGIATQERNLLSDCGLP
uniref:Uncharacterized protein n=1 Tax=Parascaris equorum TaxID=6256 RepID=A0A914RKW5_PAREQ